MNISIIDWLRKWVASMRHRIMKKVGFDVVHGCQLRCIGCPNSVIQSNIKYISVEDFRICLGNIDVNSVKTFRLFNFGEPLLHPNLVEIVLEIPKQSWTTKDIEISTNAQYFNEDVMTDLFKTNIITHLSVSCDGDGTPDLLYGSDTKLSWLW